MIPMDELGPGKFSYRSDSVCSNRAHCHSQESSAISLGDIISDG